MKLAITLIVLCVVATGSAQQPEAPFKHPKAVQAWNRFQFRENKAREAYDREVAAAKAEYLAGLREAASLAAKAGDAGDVKAIGEAMEGERPTAKPNVKLGGTWRTMNAEGDSMLVSLYDDGRIVPANPRAVWRNWKMDGNSVVFVEEPPSFFPVTVYMRRHPSGSILYLLPINR